MDTGSDHLTQLAGPFFGNGLGFADLERTMLERATPEWCAGEPELTHKTWFDYRHAQPVLRAYFFQHSYTLAWRRAYRRFYDHDAYVQNERPWTRSDLFQNKPKLVRQTLNLMSVVDELGIPCEVFFDAGFHHLMQEREYKVWKKRLGNMKLPPIRSFNDGRVMIAAQALFDRMNARRLRWATHPSYRAESYRGLPWQEEHQRYLCTEARKRSAGCIELVVALINEHKILTEVGAAPFTAACRPPGGRRASRPGRG